MSSTGFAASGKANIYFETVGEGRSVVFIHAGIADSRMWDPQFDAPPGGAQLVRLDLRGFGNTRVPREGYTDCEDVLAVMDHLDIEKAVVVGCSMGGEAALDIAALAPYRLDGLVLIGADAPGFDAPSTDSAPPQWQDLMEAIEAGGLERVAEVEAEMWIVGRDRDRADVDPRILELVRDMNIVALRNEPTRGRHRKPVKLEALPHIEVPSLIVVGQHDHPQFIEAAEHLENAIEHARAVVIEDSAHLPSLEQPDAFNAEFEQFLTA